MTFNYSMLRGKIAEKCKTNRGFSEAMGLSEHSVSCKMNGKVAWRQSEIVKACDVLDIPATDIPRYFFSLEVQS